MRRQPPPETLVRPDRAMLETLPQHLQRALMILATQRLDSPERRSQGPATLDQLIVELNLTVGQLDEEATRLEITGAFHPIREEDFDEAETTGRFKRIQLNPGAAADDAP